MYHMHCTSHDPGRNAQEPTETGDYLYPYFSMKALQRLSDAEASIRAVESAVGDHPTFITLQEARTALPDPASTTLPESTLQDAARASMILRTACQNGCSIPLCARPQFKEAERNVRDLVVLLASRIVTNFQDMSEFEGILREAYQVEFTKDLRAVLLLSFHKNAVAHCLASGMKASVVTLHSLPLKTQTYYQ